MPRLTRRSLAAKEEEQVTTVKGKRGSKKAEPVEEPLPIGEGSTTAKTPRSARGKATPAPKAGRGKGKKDEDQDNEVEETVEEESPAPKRGARGSLAKKEVQEEKKSTPAQKRTARGGRAKRGAESEEEVEEEEEEIEPPAKRPARGGRGKKEEAVSPSPKKSGRGARGKKEEKDDVEAEEEVVETPTPKGRRGGRSSQSTAPTPPASSGRRSGGRGKRGEGDGSSVEIAAASTAAPAGRSKRGAKKEDEAEAVSTESVGAEQESVEENDVSAEGKSSEPELESGSGQEKQSEMESKSKAVDSDDIEAMKTDDLELTATDTESGKKRKHEEDDAEEESSSKKMRVEDVDKKADDTEGFVVVNKEDLPAADSKEVLNSLPPVVESEETKDDEASEDGIVVMPAPAVVPLTEAELAKQYNPTIRDRDDDSSMMVEVGSEAASDIGSVSRNLDVSEVTGMDITAQEEDSKDGLTSTDAPPAKQAMEDSTSAPSNESNPIITSGNSTEDLSSIPPPKSPVTQTTLIDTAKSNSVPLPPTDSQNVTNSASHSMDGNVPQPSPVVSQPLLAPPSTIPPPPALNSASQNGNCQSTKVTESVPLCTSTPAKKAVILDNINYVPSSTSITQRKVLSNPKFPIELMDPAFWFSVVSYNILADCHLRRYDYSYTESQYLDATFRHSLFMKEFDYLDSDILCLQEVDTKYYHDVLLPAMTSRGYHGVFMKRTQDWYDEGEATFVKTSKFEVLSHQGISLKDLAFKEIEAAGLTGDVARAAKKYVDRADVVLLCSLKSKKTGKFLTVANIHVAFAQTAPDLQCIQVASAVKELVSQAGSDLNPYIICGDFNSETTSPAYQLAKDGYLSDEHIRQLLNIQSMDNTEGDSHSIIKYLWKAFQHTSSNMKSAYETCAGKEPSVTSSNNLVKACLDYIFFSSSTLHSVNVLQVLDPQVVHATAGLPSQHIPSDHLSMKAIFRLKDD